MRHAQAGGLAVVWAVLWMSAAAGEAALWTEHAVTDGEAGRLAREVMPFTRETIERAGALVRETQAATQAARLGEAPQGRIRRVALGAVGAVPVVRLRSGFVTALLFTDMTGAPWPIEEVLVDARFLPEGREGGEGEATLQTAAAQAAGVIAHAMDFTVAATARKCPKSGSKPGFGDRKPRRHRAMSKMLDKHVRVDFEVWERLEAAVKVKNRQPTNSSSSSPPMPSTARNGLTPISKSICCDLVCSRPRPSHGT